MPPRVTVRCASGYMLENLRIPTTSTVPSGRYRDNVTGADNQQERLIQLGWVTGFVDGEGCFSIGFVRQPCRAGRRGYKAGYQVSHRFVVTQSVGSRSALEELKSFFGVGRVYVNARHDDHREHLGQFIVNRREDLLGTVVPFFEAHPLHTTKQRDFEKFALCMRSDRGRPASRCRRSDGDREDRRDDEPEDTQARSDQNPQRPYARGPGHWIMRWSHLHGDMQGRHACTRTCRPARGTVLGKGKSEIPCRVSSDLHEWRNDFSAVSTRSSVKLQSR